MPGWNLRTMDVDVLLALRARITDELASRLRDLERRLRGDSKDPSVVRRNGGASPMKGAKVKPKYRDSKTGDTWAGRGVQPRWLTAALKGGRKLEDFLIDKSARKSTRKGRRKRR